MAEADRIPEPFPNQPIETPPAENIRMRIEAAYVSSAPAAVPPAFRSYASRSGHGVYADNGDWRDSLRATLSSVSEMAGEIVEAAERESRRALRRAGEEWELALLRGRRNAIYYSESAKTRVSQFADEDPLKAIAVAAGAGVIVGAVFRLWRSSRYE
ncbi:MAG: hypothetical protein H0X25_04535 [Acidobacteriales bacterium]|nr:hypothetical protein [Terriglobales bacterium]